MYTSLAGLADTRYVSLTTRRRDGSLVSTPVWVASDDGRRLLIWTGASTWKVKRIRRDPRVFVAKSNYRGRDPARQVGRGLQRRHRDAAHASAVAQRYTLNPRVRDLSPWRRSSTAVLSRTVYYRLVNR